MRQMIFSSGFRLYIYPIDLDLHVHGHVWREHIFLLVWFGVHSVLDFRNA
jgi:hypothetical protein